MGKLMGASGVGPFGVGPFGAALTHVTMLGVALMVFGVGCTCGSPSDGIAADTMLPDPDLKTSSLDGAYDRGRALSRERGGLDTLSPDLVSLPPCGGRRMITPKPVMPYTPRPCGKACEQITFGRWVELDSYRVRGEVLVYSSLVKGAFFELHALDLKTGKEVQLSTSGPLARSCPVVATDGTSLIAGCAVFHKVGGTIARFSISRIDLTTFEETDIYCRDIPFSAKPCIAESMDASRRLVALSWNPGKCGGRPHTISISGGPLVKLASVGRRIAISDEHVVWVGWSGGSSLSTIVIYDLATGKEKPLSPGPGAQSFPRIDGDQVVWVDGRNKGPALLGTKGNHDIYYYNLTKRQELAITRDAAVQLEPDVSGKWVVWEDWRASPGGDPAVNKSNSDIYAYNLKTHQEVQLTNFPGRELSPRVDRDRVFFRMGDMKGNANLFMIDLTKRFAK
ncbi:MAG: hypothetical protein KAI47_28015 [Deltaproteobacteria bacterium]|nr:hypothetical protein [Deltaproteobacteria bacterium]